MQLGKRRFLREHALNQAILVWGLEDLDMIGFLETGMYHKARTDRVVISDERNKAIQEQLAEAKAHGGLIQVKPRIPKDGIEK